jgi:nucleolysin TIA-1/TIAR
MYGMPQPTAYGQYGFTGYTGFPGQAGAAPGATGPGSPGMPQAAGPAAPGLGLNVGAQQPGADLTSSSSAQPGQPQWGAADPNYYSAYWGGALFIINTTLSLINSSLGYYSQQGTAAGGQQPTGDAMPGQSA